MRLGVLLLPTDPWPETVARARRLEALGYHHLWTYDHLSWRRYRDRDWHAAVPWLTGIAAATSRVRVGPMVASPNFRHPVTLAKDAMTLDHVSGGRLTLGVGAGGVGFDSTVLGGTVLPPADRAGRLAEFVEVLDRLLREPATSHRGRWYTVDEARMLPGCVQRPRLPIAVAAAGPATIRLAGRLGDEWITYADDATARSHAAMLDEACVAAGRDPSSVRRVFLAGNDDERPLASMEAFLDFLGRREELGFTDVVLHHPRPDDPGWDDPVSILDEIADRLLPGAGS